MPGRIGIERLSGLPITFLRSSTVHRYDPALKALMDQAQARGFLTYQMVDEYLPDEGGDVSMVEHIIHALEEIELPLINDPAAPRTIADKTRQEMQAKEGTPLPSDIVEALIEPESPMSSRDPIRMYLSQMGNILCSTGKTRSSWPRKSRSPASGIAAS